MSALSLSQLDSIFRRYTEHVPVALALRETMRMVALAKNLPEGSTILDVGCGDGSFWHLYPYREGLTIDGIDLAIHETALASSLGVYRHLELGDISKTVPEQRYDVALGNCSLEHVPNIHAALVNIRKSLKPGGTLLLFVPAFGWTRTLRIVRLLELASTRLAMAASGALDGFFQHHHLYGRHTWQLIVENAGYRVEEVAGLGTRAVNQRFERELPQGLFDFLFKSVMKRYPPPYFRRKVGNAVLAEILAQPVPVDSQHLVEYMFRATPI